MTARVHIEGIRNRVGTAGDLAPYEFEALVAELLAGFGWQVSVTSPTRDGGYDILGLAGDASSLQTSWVVECKRYGRQHKVGVETVRQLLGVKEHIGVPNAVIVTTSRFTQGALDYCRSRNDIHLVDGNKLDGWIQQYRPPESGAAYLETKSFSSCFVSYSSKDEAFAQQLVSALKRRGIKTWYAPENLQPGNRVYDQVKNAISAFDRLIVVLSANSLSSNWVGSEIALALKKEREEGRRVLFPVSLVDFERLRSWEMFDADTGFDVGKQIREYHIPNFSTWKDSAAFEKGIDKIAEALVSSIGPSATESRVKAAVQSLRKGATPDDRRRAALALAQLRDDAENAVPALSKALKDPSMYVRGAAAYALGEIDTPTARSALAAFEDGPAISNAHSSSTGEPSPALQLKTLFDRLDELRDVKLFVGNSRGWAPNSARGLVEPANVGTFLSSLDTRHAELNIRQVNDLLASFLKGDRKEE